jgi:acyl-CoA synthetase (AMP-forming)/AMP-acid ligase II
MCVYYDIDHRMWRQSVLIPWSSARAAGGTLSPGTIPIPPPPLPALRVVALGGEPMPRALAAAWLPRLTMLANTYGVTECCVYQAFHRVGGNGGEGGGPGRVGEGGGNSGGGLFGGMGDTGNGCSGGSRGGGSSCGNGGNGGISSLSLDSGCQLRVSQRISGRETVANSCDGSGGGGGVISGEGRGNDAVLNARRGLGGPLGGCRLLMVKEPGDDPSDLLPDCNNQHYTHHCTQMGAHSCATERYIPLPPQIGCDALSWQSLSNVRSPLLPQPPLPGTVELAELWIAGPQVGLGYANMPELTAEKFRRVRLGNTASGGSELEELCFRTGDVVRRTWGMGGWCTVEVVGRRDAQVYFNPKLSSKLYTVNHTL